MKVDLVMVTFNRAEGLRRTVLNVLERCGGLNRIFVINNDSTDATRDVLQEFHKPKLMIIHNKQNLGAAGGKNVGLRRSNADIIIVIDDDAHFISDNPADKVRDVFLEDERLGIIQFKIVDHKTGRVLKYEFPGDDPDADGNRTFNIGYFIGAGHAIRTSMLKDIGYYDESLGLYAHEEIDLSYRAVQAGYTLRYLPTIAVRHMKAPGGRMRKTEVLQSLFFNRLFMTRKFLPFPYSSINNFFWFIKTVLDSRSLTLALRVYREFLRNQHLIRRDPLSPEAMKYLRQNGGRVFR